MASAPLFQWVDHSERADYDINTTYARSCDEKGHYECIRVNMPGHIKARLEQIVATEANCPWRSTADVMRDAVFHRLHWWAEQRGHYELEGFLVNERIAAAFAREAEEDRQNELLFDKMTEKLGRLRKANDLERLASTLLLAQQVVENMRPWWAHQMATAIAPYQDFLEHEAE